MTAFLITLGVVGALVLLVVLWLVGTYNSLVRMRQEVKNAWAQIDVQLKRRADLIPNLVNAVKGYLKHEREVLEQVTQARYKAMQATGVRERAQAEGELSQVLGRLFAVFENYPELKANQNVLELQEELTHTENAISFARQHYNDVVMKYNTRLQSFPTNLVAGAFGFREAEFFEVPEAQREAPKVDLSY